MTAALYGAAALAFGVGFAHSILGERYILVRLFRRQDLPRLFGGTAFTTRTLRFAWHLTTLAWWGFGAMLMLLARDAATPTRLSWVIAVTFLASAALTAAISRGRHLAWLVFLTIGSITLWTALG